MNPYSAKTLLVFFYWGGIGAYRNRALNWGDAGVYRKNGEANRGERDNSNGNWVDIWI